MVRDALTFRAAVWLSGRARDLKAGEYRFDQAMSAADVVDKLARGDVYRRMVTFREGLTIAEMAAVFADARLGRRRISRRPPAIRRPSAISIRRRAISRAICSPTPTRSAAPRRRPTSCAR